MLDSAMAAGVNVVEGGVGSWVSRRALLSGERTALADDERQVTYAELDRRTTRLANALQNLGVRKGDRVAALLSSSVTFIEIFLAVAKAGAVFVPINYRLAAPEVTYLLADSGADVLVWSVQYSALARSALAGGGVRVRVEIVAGGEPGAGELGVEPVLASGDPAARLAHVAGGDLCALMYTSGTTGRPKGVMLTHDNFLWNTINVLSNGRGYQATDCTVTVAPLFHIGALSGSTLPLLYVGGRNVIMSSFDARETLATMSRERATVQFLVPAMWAALMAVPDFDSYDLSALQVALTGGAPCPRPVLDYFRARGVPLREGFGMTETAPEISTLDEDNAQRKAGSIGRPSFHVQTRIVDESDHDVSPGKVGELVVRGPNVFLGYWGMSEATAEAFRGGWFHTGDLVRRDDEGFMFLAGRKKDMIISGGENIYPAEIESVLLTHPAVREVAVIGMPHEKWGETPVAVVCLAPGSRESAESLIEFARERIARFKCPTRVHFVSELPRNSTGKIMKTTLRSEVGNVTAMTAT